MLELFNMALKNIRRRVSRSSLTATGLACFVLIFVMVSSVTLTMQRNVAESISEFGGEIMMWDQGALVPFLSTIPENYTDKLEEIQYVKRIIPQITGVSRIESEDFRFTIGINPSDIPLIYPHTIVEGVMLTSNTSEAVLGHLFADFIKKHVGENVTINGHTFPIVGIYKTDTWVDNVAMVPFTTAQTIFGFAGRASLIVVIVSDLAKIDFVIDQIETEIPGVNAFKTQEATARLAPIMDSVSLFSYILSALAGAACLFGVANVTLTSILERTREIGILKAIGATGTDVTKIMLYESAVLGMLGGFLGSLISSALLVQGLLVPVTSTSTMRILLFPEVIFEGIILAVAISTLAALYPVWRAVRVRPNEVLRFG